MNNITKGIHRINIQWNFVFIGATSKLGYSKSEFPEFGGNLPLFASSRMPLPSSRFERILDIIYFGFFLSST